MAIQGPLSPSNATSTGSPAWTSPTRITASDDLKSANNNLPPAGTTGTLTSSEHGFTIPAGATIDGILLEVERSGDGGEIADSSIRLVTGGVAVGANKATGDPWPGAGVEAYASYGGASDTWGRAWTASEINSPDFGAAIVARNTSATATRSARVDHVRITVYYTVAGGTTHDAAASFAGTGTLAAAPGVTLAGAATLGGSGVLAADPAATYGSGSALGGTGTLAASGALTLGGASALAGSGSLAVDGFLTGGGAAALSGAGTLSAVPDDAGGTTHESGASLGGAGLLAVAAGLTLPGGAALTGSGALASTPALSLGGTAQLAGLGLLAGVPGVTLAGGSVLAGIGSMVAAGPTDPETLPTYGVTSASGHLTSATAVSGGIPPSTAVTGHTAATTSVRGSQ